MEVRGMSEAIAKKHSPARAILDFFNSPACFRFCFLIVLYFALKPAAAVMMLWAAYLFVHEMLVKRRIKRMHYRRVIYAFLAVSLISVGIHWNSNLVPNLLSVCTTATAFFMFYGIHAEKSNYRVKKEICRILYFFVIATTVLMVAGLILLAVFPGGITVAGLPVAIYENRFTGVFVNANVAGFYSVMALISCHLLYRSRRAEKRLTFLRLWLYVTCVLVNLLTLFLSDSNAALLFLIVYSSFLAFYFIFRDFNKKKIHSFLLRFVATGLSLVVITSSALFLRTYMQGRVSLMLTSGASDIQMSTGIIAEDGSVTLAPDTDRKPSSGTKVNNDEEDTTTFTHQNTNIDSGRYAVWRQALQLAEKFPIFGIGKENFVDYGKAYIGGLKYPEFHNALLTILVSCGLVGLNIFFVLALTIAKAMLKAIFNYKDKCRRDGSILVLIVAFCAAYCVYSMFEPALVLDFSPRVYLFWLLIGFGISYVVKYKKQAAAQHKETDNTISTDQTFSDYLKKRFTNVDFTAEAS